MTPDMDVLDALVWFVVFVLAICLVGGVLRVIDAACGSRQDESDGFARDGFAPSDSQAAQTIRGVRRVK